MKFRTLYIVFLLINISCQDKKTNRSVDQQLPSNFSFYFDLFMKKEIIEIKLKTVEYYYIYYTRHFSNKCLYIFLGKSQNNMYLGNILFLQEEKFVPLKRKKVYSSRILVENPLLKDSIPYLSSKFSIKINQNIILDNYLSSANFLPVNESISNSIEGSQLVIVKQKTNLIEKLSIDTINKTDSMFLDQLIRNSDNINLYFKTFTR